MLSRAYSSGVERGIRIAETAVQFRLGPPLRTTPLCGGVRLYFSKFSIEWGSFFEIRALSSAGRALPWHGRGRRFESGRVHQTYLL